MLDLCEISYKRLRQYPVSEIRLIDYILTIMGVLPGCEPREWFLEGVFAKGIFIIRFIPLLTVHYEPSTTD
jgi:hypothetical protein